MSLPSACLQVHDRARSNEFDRLKSRGSSSSISMGEELTTSSNNSESGTDYQHQQPIRNSGLKIPAKLEEDPKSSKSDEPKFLDEGNALFQYIDPQPANPPKYATINPNRRIRFPIYECIERCPRDAVPPKYSPAVDSFTVISMKVEWLSPYEASQSRQWKNYIMEINSTQLNFYRIDDSLTAGIKNYYNGDQKVTSSHSHHSHLFSLSSRSTYQFNKADQERISMSINKNRKKYLTNDRIVKTYSLQCAKLGIPTDYTKKTFVLRMRCESEQFLLNFSHVDDMIMSTMYLQMGICVSLDLDLRELPTYRVVPRRRRRRRRKNRDGFFSDSHSRSNSISRLHINRTPPPSGHGRVKTPKEELSAEKIKTTRSLTSGILNMHSRSPSAGRESKMRTRSTPSSRKGSVTEETTGSPGLKSKLRGLFKNRRTVSTRQITLEKFQSQTRGLNSVLEDAEEEDPAIVRTKSLPAKELPNNTILPSPALNADRSISRNLPPDMNLMKSHASAFTNDQKNNFLPMTPEEELISPGMTSLDSYPVQRYNTHTQREIDEFRAVVREHAEDAHVVENENETMDCLDMGALEADDDDDDEEEEGEDDDDDASGTGRTGSRSDPPRSVYADEGIFHDSDDDYVYTMERRIGYRNRASSTTSALSNTPYGSDEVKWNPPIKEMSRRRYIRDSLRCIKPLSEGHRWIGKVVVRPTRPPLFETNNPPITVGVTLPDTRLSRGRYTPSQDYFYGEVEYKQTKNHYLKVLIAGPAGFLKAGTKVFNQSQET